MQTTLRLAALLALATVSLPASDAAACAAPGCAPVRFFPQSSPTADEVPEVPENGAVLTMLSWGAPATTSTLSATRVRGGESTEIELAAEGDLVPLEGALEGDVWTVRESHECSIGEAPEGSTTVRIGPAAVEPLALGTLLASAPARGPVEVLDSRGSCSSGLDSVAVHLEVELDASAAPWAEVLRWETLVDGEPFAYPSSLLDASPAGPRETVFVACVEPEPGQFAPDLAEGTHLVQRRAYLPGSSTPIATDEIEIELRCAPAESSSGCSVARGTRTGGALGLLASLGVLAVLARRRRS